MLNYERIPHEMRAYKQWLTWRYEDRGAKKPTKVPYDPRTGRLSSVTDSDTWVTFDEAVAAASANIGYDGIGFVLTRNDPYTFIDLDDTEGDAESFERQKRVYEEFNSYTELSPSGKGLHVIVKGHIPSGRRRSKIEIYSDDRYMTMTGDVYRDSPIVDQQLLCRILWEQIGGSMMAKQMYDHSSPQTMTDEEVIQRACEAANGDKFRLLLDGRWNEIYSSQSEADFAFINIISFYSMNREQIVRLFRMSPLGQRTKAQRTGYVEGMVNRSFDRILPPIDIEGLQNAWDEAKAVNLTQTNPAPFAHTTEPDPEAAITAFWNPQKIMVPPGLVGEIAQYIYAASPRPVPEIAIAAALALVAGISGRAYNISGTGLNLYIILLAATGTGKEAMAGGINKLMAECFTTTCQAAQAFIGPTDIASGQALQKYLDKALPPCFLSIIGEFGLRLQQLANPRASTSDSNLKRVLLDLYNKSGRGNSTGVSAYADKDKNTSTVLRPSVTLLGESTPETFYAALDEGMIADGLLPRCLFIEYEGERVPLNKHHAFVAPSASLIDKMRELALYSLQLQKNNDVLDVAMTPDAEAFMDRIGELADAAINSARKDTVRHLWNRAHIKALKVASVLAVGNNAVNPVITLADAEWAYNVVSRDVTNVAAKFARGEVGRNTEQIAQAKAVLKVMVDFLTRNDDKPYMRPYLHLREQKIVPWSHIQRVLASHGLFKDDKLGATGALKRAVQNMLDAGDIRELNRVDLEKKHDHAGRGFMFNNPAQILSDL